MAALVHAPECPGDWEFLEWLRPEGSWVARGELLCALGGATQSIEIPASAQGFLRYSPQRPRPGMRIAGKTMLAAICEIDETPPWESPPAPRAGGIEGS